jgi:hypothetical protein
MTAECGYTHDVSAERFEDIPDDTWTCSRDAVADGRCVFHADPDAVSEEAVSEAFVEAVATEKGPLRLVGAHLGSVSLDYAILDGPSNHPIDLRETEIEGTLSARYVTVKRPLRLDGAHLHGRVDFEDATFTRRVDFGGATFEDRVSLRLGDFESWLDIRETDFHGPVYMRVATFRRGIYGVDATFHAAADFLNTRFADVANFYRATFRRGAIFDSSTFEGNAQFYEATIDAPAVKLDSASGSPRSERERREGVALSLDGATCERDLRLSGATLGGDVAFTDSDLGRDLECGHVSTADGAVVDCSGTAVVSGEIAASDGAVTYDLSRATVGELDLVDDAAFDVFRFDETTFSGFDFGAYKRDLAARGWRLHDSGADHPPERLENLYLRAKNGANEIGETRASAEFFIHEMSYRRLAHRERAMAGDGLRERASGLAGWLSNAALRLTCGYGERPFRPVVFSLGLISLFAGIYAWLDAPITYVEPLGYLTFSVEGFVSLILGLPEITGSALSFVVALEGFLGGFVIALFVFTLTRSISR